MPFIPEWRIQHVVCPDGMFRTYNMPFLAPGEPRVPGVLGTEWKVSSAVPCVLARGAGRLGPVFIHRRDAVRSARET